MIKPTRSALLAATFAATAALGACAPQPQRLPLIQTGQAAPASAAAQAGTPGASRADAATACRAEVDRVYAAQNRADLSTRDDRDTPFAANYLPGVTTRGLGARYGRDSMLQGCLANASGGGRSGAGVSDGNPGPTFNPAAR